MINEYNEYDVLNQEAEIKEDEKIVEELNKKIEEYERQIENYTEKRNDLENTLSDLHNKSAIEDISSETKAKIEEVTGQVKIKLDEVNTQINSLSGKIQEITETLAPIPPILSISPIPPVPMIPPIPPEPPIPSATQIPPESPTPPDIPAAPAHKINYAVLEKEAYIKELELKIKENEKKISEYERLIEKTEDKIQKKDERIDEKIRVLEDKKSRFEETAESIDDKMNGDGINDATRERLEQMYDEIQEKIDETQERIDELEDQKGEEEDRINEEIDGYNEIIDGLNEEIDGYNEEIENIREEIEEIENNTVDEDVINELQNLPGFSDFDVDTPRISHEPITNIPKVNIRIPEQTPPYDNFDRNQKYNVNFCSVRMGAKIYAVCCEHSGAERAVNLLDDDPNFKEKWCAADKHKNINIVNPHCAVIDLGEIKTFNYLKLVKCSPGHGHRDDTGNTRYDASAWRFEISNDREHWIEFNRETNDNSAIYEKKFGELTGRYIRLLVDAGGSDPNNKHHGVRFYDLRIELLNDDGSNSINLCKDARIESCCPSGWGGEIRNLIDDDPEYKTKWYIEGAHEEKRRQPHWVIVDMGAYRTFNHLRIVKASEGKHDAGHRYKDISAWRVEVSNDREHWTEFNRETNDQSSVYSMTFAPQSGRYIRLWVDAGENDPNDIEAHVRIYDLRIEMLDRKENRGEVTFDDIIAIAPFAKKETLDKLVDKLIEMDDFNKVRSLAPFLSKETLNKLISKVSGKIDSNTIRVLAPYLSKETLAVLVEKLDEDMDFEKIKILAPYLSKEALSLCVTKSGKVDMKLLRNLAPFLGSDMIDEIISKML